MRALCSRWWISSSPNLAQGVPAAESCLYTLKWARISLIRHPRQWDTLQNRPPNAWKRYSVEYLEWFIFRVSSENGGDFQPLNKTWVWMQDLPLLQVQGQLAFQLNFKFSSEVLHPFFCTMWSLVVFGWTLTDYSQTNKQTGAREGSTFFLLTFKAQGRNSLLIEVRGGRIKSRGQSQGFHRAALLKSLGWAVLHWPGYYSVQGCFYAMHMLMMGGGGI